MCELRPSPTNREELGSSAGANRANGVTRRTQYAVNKQALTAFLPCRDAARRPTSRMATVWERLAGTPAPRASFLSLPIEIKAIIVKEANQADRNYRKRLASSGAREKKIGGLLKSEWYGRSLSALFRVNKELSGLAAVHLFQVSGNVECLQSCADADLQVVKASRCLEPVFQWSIQGKRAHNFRRLEFDDAASPEALTYALRHIPVTSTGLRTLSITANAATSLLGPLSAFFTPELDMVDAEPPSATQEYIAASFRALGESIEVLSLQWFSGENVALILGCFPNITSLAIHGDTIFRDKHERLATVLATYSLTHLTLQPFSRDGRICDILPLSFTTSDWNSTHSLRSFHLTTARLFANDLAFAHRFSSLHSLSLEFRRFGQPIDKDTPHGQPPLLTPVSLPHLSSISLRGPPDECFALLTLLDDSPLTTLSLPHAPSLANDSAFLPMLRSHKKLETISCGGVSDSHEVARSALAKVGVRLLPARPVELFSSKAAKGEGGNRMGQTRVVCDALDTVLKFVGERSKTFAVNGDVDGAVEVIKLAERLQALMMAFHD